MKPTMLDLQSLRRQQLARIERRAMWRDIGWACLTIGLLVGSVLLVWWWAGQGGQGGSQGLGEPAARGGAKVSNFYYGGSNYLHAVKMPHLGRGGEL